MPMGKHYGSFAKGFSDSLIAMMRLGMTMQLYQARADYYRDRGWAATHPHGKALTQAELDEEMRRAREDPNYGHYGGGEGGGGSAVSGKFWTPENQQHAYN